MKVLLASLLVAVLLAGCASIVGIGESAPDINSFRAVNGRAPLRSDPAMTALAQTHAQDMARRGALDHAGFMQQRGPAGARAENVAYGCAEAACTIRQWINSPSHRANMLRTDISSYGLASAVSKSGRRYWAMELGQ